MARTQQYITTIIYFNLSTSRSILVFHCRASLSLLFRRQLFSKPLKISTIITIKRCWHDIKKFVHANKHNNICLSINARLKRQGVLRVADVSSFEDDDVDDDDKNTVELYDVVSTG